mgnify:CR=1 FL=1
MFMTSMEELVDQDSWARIVDLFVDAMPIKEFGITHVELNKEDDRSIQPEVDEGPGDLQASVGYGLYFGIREGKSRHGISTGGNHLQFNQSSVDLRVRKGEKEAKAPKSSF